MKIKDISTPDLIALVATPHTHGRDALAAFRAELDRRLRPAPKAGKRRLGATQ